ncbi:MAG: hypothetical protein M0Z41_15355 [Peptococcaceae bacterium]|jgi:hypothetical protein|nr:hypothetical protein [Peptococcaceae bacterium]
MSPAIEKISREFFALLPDEQINFLKTVIATPPGQLVQLDGRVHFIPEGSPADDEEKELFARAEAEIEAGKGITLDELRANLKI